MLKLWGCSMALAGLCICLTASVSLSYVSPYVSEIVYDLILIFYD